MDVDCPETVASSSQPCIQTPFNPMAPSTSRVATPARPSSRMSSNRQYPGSPFRAQPQNMEPSNSRVQELRDAAVGKRSYTSEWMHNGYSMPPGMQQNQHQRPPSMIGSTMSTISNMSHMSDMTTLSYGGLSVLSVNTDLGPCDWHGQSQQALSRVSNMPSTENQDPMKMPKKMSPDEIVQNLRSYELAHQAAALRELEQPMSRPYNLEYMWAPPQLKAIILSLFEVLLPRPVEHENVIYKTLQLLYRSIINTAKTKVDKMFIILNKEMMSAQKPSSIYDIVMERASRLDTKYETAAACLLTHLCCKPYFMRHIFSDAQKAEAYQRLHRKMLTFSIHLMGRIEAKPKTRGFAVSIIKNLTHKNRTIMAMAMEMHVVRIFLEIMKNDVIHEDLLWTTMRALNSFCHNTRNGETFVLLGGAQVLCGLLSHGSTRLLHELLGCMKQIADLPAIQEQNMEESIHCVVQLIGSSDSTIVERSTATLRNIALYNKHNKTFMVRNGVTSHALAVLRTSAQFTFQTISDANPEAVRQEISSIYENCLSILNNVTSMSPQDNVETARAACGMISQNPDSAHVLLHFFNVGSRKCRKLAVNVMKRVIDNVPAFAEPFVDLVGTTNEPLAMLLLQRAWQSLEEFRKAQSEIMQCGFAPENPARRELDVKKKDHEDIVKRSVSLLTTLCTNANPRFFQSIEPLINDGRFNPFTWLSHDMSDAILYEWLTFIWDLSMTERAVSGKLLFHLLRNSNVQFSFFDELYNRRQSPQIKKLIKGICDEGENQSQQQHRQQQQQQQQLA